MCRKSRLVIRRLMFIVHLPCLETFDKQCVATAEKRRKKEKRCRSILQELAKIMPHSAQLPCENASPSLTHISPAERAGCRFGPVMNYTETHSLWEIWIVQERRGSEPQRQIAFTASQPVFHSSLCCRRERAGVLFGQAEVIMCSARRLKTPSRQGESL